MRHQGETLCDIMMSHDFMVSQGTGVQMRVTDKQSGVLIGLTSQTLKFLGKIHLSIPVSPRRKKGGWSLILKICPW